MADISLTASMRSNLLSLQQTQSLMDTTQERLSTGKKVNSAIDNPSSYYTAQSLTNRASDLNALLDSMGQGIQTIQAANEGIEAITDFVQQAKALANTARDNATIKGITSSGTYASPTGGSGADQEITVSVEGNENQTITFSIADDATIEDAAEALQHSLLYIDEDVEDNADNVRNNAEKDPYRHGCLKKLCGDPDLCEPFGGQAHRHVDCPDEAVPAEFFRPGDRVSGERPHNDLKGQTDHHHRTKCDAQVFFKVPIELA